jgi:hypothetical protein
LADISQKEYVEGQEWRAEIWNQFFPKKTTMKFVEMNRSSKKNISWWSAIVNNRMNKYSDQCDKTSPKDTRTRSKLHLQIKWVQNSEKSLLKKNNLLILKLIIINIQSKQLATSKKEVNAITGGYIVV